MRKLLTYACLLLFCLTILGCGLTKITPEKDVSVSFDPEHGLPMAVPEAVGVSAERLERIRPVMQDYVDKGHLPGFLTVVATTRERLSILKPSACEMLRITNRLSQTQYSAFTRCRNRLRVLL